jgi:hypothetical protein
MKKLILIAALATVSSLFIEGETEAWIFSRNNAVTREKLEAAYGTSVQQNTQALYNTLNKVASALGTLNSKTKTVVNTIKTLAKKNSAILTPPLQTAMDSCQLAADKTTVANMVKAMKDVYQFERYSDVMLPKLKKAVTAADGVTSTSTTGLASFPALENVIIAANSHLTDTSGKKALQQLETAYKNFYNLVVSLALFNPVANITADVNPIGYEVSLLFNRVAVIKTQIMNSSAAVGHLTGATSIAPVSPGSTTVPFVAQPVYATTVPATTGTPAKRGR